MKKIFILLFIGFFICHAESTNIKECEAGDIIGFWLSPRNKISGRQSIIEFIKKDGKYFAYHVVFMDDLPNKKDEFNDKFSLREREILGSVFIYNLNRNEENSYINGRYYDFNNGKIFHLRVRKECQKLIFTISLDNIGVLGVREIYEYVEPEDAEFYIKNKKPNIDFSGVD